MSRERQRTTEEQIDDLTAQLQSITQQLSALKLQVKRERENTARRNSRSRNETRRFPIGDRVEVTNGYQNLQGTSGIIIRLSTTFVTLRTDEGTEIVRGTQNVRLITTDE